jgi:hypothetical protein
MAVALTQCVREVSAGERTPVRAVGETVVRPA